MSKRALVIEDEANIASLITEIMSLLQVDASHALSAGDGLKRIAAESFDFVLIDISLPDANGLELYEQVIALQPALKENIAFMSGYTPDRKLERFLARTKSSFIQKPFQIEDLQELLKKLI